MSILTYKAIPQKIISDVNFTHSLSDVSTHQYMSIFHNLIVGCENMSVMISVDKELFNTVISFTVINSDIKLPVVSVEYTGTLEEINGKGMYYLFNFDDYKVTSPNPIIDNELNTNSELVNSLIINLERDCPLEKTLEYLMYTWQEEDTDEGVITE